LGDFATLVKNNHAIGEGRDHLDDVLDDHDGDAGGVDVADQRDSALDIRGRQAGHGLVQQQHFGSRRQGAGDFEPLAPRRSETARRRIGKGPEADVLDHHPGMGHRLVGRLVRRNAPIITFSTTVICSKVCGTWKVRRGRDGPLFGRQ